MYIPYSNIVMWMTLNMKKLIGVEKMYYVHDCRSTILADQKMLTLNTRKSNLNNNVCLVGASGRGKTRNFIKPNIMQMNSNYVISDPNG